MQWLESFRNFKREIRTHAVERMVSRNIDFIDFDEASDNLRVIEEYLDDFPYPSCLCMGFTSKKRPIHIVFAVNEKDKLSYIITVYEPDPNKWDSSFTRRKK